MSIEKRFWKKVDKRSKDECWNWIGGCTDRGYGCIGDGSNRTISAHRLSWRLHFRNIPIGKFVLHKCDNKRCINPTHLYLGTQSDNMRDRSIRNPESLQGRPSKLDSREVQDVKELYSTGNFTHSLLSFMFKCSRVTISKILKGKDAYNINLI